MAIYFRFSKFQQHITDRSVLGACVLLIALAIVHSGYCIAVQQVKNTYSNESYNSRNDIFSFSSLFDSITAYFAITAIIQSYTNVVILLILYQRLGKQSYQKWSVFIFILLVLNLVFNFGAAALAGLQANFFIKYGTLPDYYNSYQLELYTKYKVFFQYGIAEAVLTLLLTIPLISYLLFTTLEILPNQDEGNKGAGYLREVQLARADSHGEIKDNEKKEDKKEETAGQTKIDVV